MNNVAHKRDQAYLVDCLKMVFSRGASTRMRQSELCAKAPLIGDKSRFRLVEFGIAWGIPTSELDTMIALGFELNALEALRSLIVRCHGSSSDYRREMDLGAPFGDVARNAALEGAANDYIAQVLAWLLSRVGDFNRAMSDRERRGAETRSFYPLFLAAASDSRFLLEEMIRLGADPLLRDGNRGTILHGARRGYMVDAILAQGVDPDAINALGRTALHEAVARADDGAARRLIERGADPDARDNRNRSPRDYAIDGELDWPWLLAPARDATPAADRTPNEPA